MLRIGALLPMLPASALAASAAPAVPQLAPPKGSEALALASDTGYWASVARQYDITDEVVLLDNAYWGSMALPVLEYYQRQVAMVNRGNSWYGRVRFP
ncbi:MAG: hypothetical protein RLZZ237_1637, partial [Pseudomonadota bacterium]